MSLRDPMIGSNRKQQLPSKQSAVMVRKPNQRSNEEDEQYLGGNEFVGNDPNMSGNEILGNANSR